MSFRFDRFDGDLTVAIHDTLPDLWPSAANPGGWLGHVFQMREFVTAWMASFGRDTRYTPHFAVISASDGPPLMLLPLVLERRHGVRILGFMDQGQADYNGPLLAPEMAVLGPHIPAAFWPALLARLPRFDLLRLEKMPEMIGGIGNPLVALGTAVHPASCHGNDLSKPVKQIESALLSPKEVRGKERALAQIGPVEFVVERGAPPDATLLEALIAQKQRRFEETNVPGFGENPEALAFLRAAHAAFGRSGNTLVFALKVDGEVTAVQWGLAHADRYYALVTGFAAGRWSKFSCGRVLNLRLLHWLKENGFRYFDQGYGDEGYKLKGTDTSVPLFDVVQARSARGRLALASARQLAQLRATDWWERLRQLKWVARRRLQRR